jgi:hypothetical protein
VGIRLRCMRRAAKLILVAFALWNFILQHEGIPEEDESDSDSSQSDHSDNEDSAHDSDENPEHERRNPRMTRNIILQRHFL